MKALIVLVGVCAIAAFGCSQDQGASARSEPVATQAGGAKPGAPGKTQIHGAAATFNGPGAANSASHVGSKLGQ